MKKSAISPFRNVDELEKSVTEFLNIHKATIYDHAKRMSDYFEMCCFNNIIKYYTEKGYTISIENLQGDKYRYKCSTQGNQENFSNFKVAKTTKGNTYEFGIYHNLAVQSNHEPDLYTTPDISIIRYNTVEHDKNHYRSKRKLYYVANMNLISFCEAKQYPPFPELMFSFMGIVNELMHSIMIKKQIYERPGHIAPSLMISGKPNEHAKKIKKSLETRYCVNIIYDVFATIENPFAKYKIRLIKILDIEKKALARLGLMFEGEIF